MRTLIASGMLCLLVMPANAAEKTSPDPKAMRISLDDAEGGHKALMDDFNAPESDADVSLNNLDPSQIDQKPEVPVLEKAVVHRPMTEVCDAVMQSAKLNNLPVSFFIRLLHQESGFRPDIVSHAGAQGGAQFMPETASRMGLSNPFDPLQAIPASARLLRELLAQFGNIGLAAAAYNAGPKRVQNWLESKNKKAKLPEETQGYVRAITGKPAENWKAAFKLVPDSRPVTRAPCKPDSGEVMQVAEAAPSEKSKLAKLAGSVKQALKLVPELKTRMASKARPTLTIIKKDNAPIMLADRALHGKPTASAVLAKHGGKAKAIKYARAG